ncbi:MAG: DNA mismatch endonuclease Vsr, partial [Bacteroidales bacterium]|nr:DNA mismatch endonuclease Vsr [Bacteroidales bacterium]
RLNVKGVPGKPDIVMRPYHTAIFVNGCFWHGHEGCDNYRKPKSNVDFWVNKIHRNQERDQQNYQILQENGWHVIVIWECQLKPNRIKETMLRVETLLCDYFLTLHRPKMVNYSSTEDTELPMAAEASEEYSH